MPVLMTQADYARHRGVTRPAVSNWKKRGLLVLAEDPADGRIKVNVDRTDAKLNAHVDPGRGRPPASSPAPASGDQAPELPIAAAPPANGADSLTNVRLEYVRHQTIGQKLKNAEAAGALAPVIELQRRASELGRVARDRLQAWYRGEAERLAAERDVRAIMAIGETGIDQVFADLADMALAGEFAADDDDDLPVEEPEDDESGGRDAATEEAA